jgi:GTP-binding protein HflX
MAETLRRGDKVRRVRLDASDGARIAWLHSRGEVMEQSVDGGEIEMKVRLSPDNWARFQALESA